MFDSCPHSWDHHHNSGNEHFHHAQKFLCTYSFVDRSPLPLQPTATTELPSVSRELGFSLLPFWARCLFVVITQEAIVCFCRAFSNTSGLCLPDVSNNPSSCDSRHVPRHRRTGWEPQLWNTFPLSRISRDGLVQAFFHVPGCLHSACFPDSSVLLCLVVQSLYIVLVHFSLDGGLSCFQVLG